MSRLIVVSNRVPDPDKPATGGLAVAVQAALKQHGGIWMGWSGQSSGDEEPGPLTIRQEGEITYALAELSARDLTEYYEGLANSVLWPLCHYRIDLTDYARRDMAGYVRVNHFFAERLAPLIEADDIIWVHDYHLLPLAAELRKMGVTNRIGFFLHIPWPSPDVFLTLPVQKYLLQAMTEFDLIGFQTGDDTENFALSLRRAGIAQPLAGEPGKFRSTEREFQIGAFPIGIDVLAFADKSAAIVGNAIMQQLHTSLEGRELIVGVDRLDYSKGIPERLQGYRRFLEANPAWHGKVTLLQITPKSRSGVTQYAMLQREVAELAGQINGALGRLDWTPVRYVNRAFSQNLLAGLYRMARIGLVTPLRDGMNLVAKEYVAAQNPQDPGVLILSRFAGAAHELAEGAVLINPYDVETIADALYQAVTMPLEERQRRHQLMDATLRSNDVYSWCDRFLAQLFLANPAHRD